MNEFAIRTFSSRINAYPESGEFVDEAQALSIIPDIPYSRGTTFTGRAIKEAVELLQNEQSVQI